MRFEVIISTRLPEKQPLSRLFIDPTQTGIRWSHVLPGGFGACTVLLPQGEAVDMFRQLSRMTGSVDGFAHLEVRAAGHTCYEGQVMQAGWIGGRMGRVVAQGYGTGGLNAREIRSSDSTLVTRGELIRQLLATYTEGVTPGQGDDWQEPGIAHALVEFDGMRVGAAIDQMLREGGPEGALYDCGVEDNQRAFLRARLAPVVPDYLVRLDDGVTTDVGSGAIWNDVAVRFEDAADDTVKLTDRIRDDQSIDRFGLRDITLEGGRMTAAGADLFRNTYMEVHRLPRYSARISRAYGMDRRGLERPDGGETPPWLVRAGQWVEIPSLDPDERVLLVITTVDYDARAGTLDVDLNGGIPDNEQAFRNVERVASAVVYRINPVTGARER